MREIIDCAATEAIEIVVAALQRAETGQCAQMSFADQCGLIACPPSGSRARLDDPAAGRWCAEIPGAVARHVRIAESVGKNEQDVRFRRGHTAPLIRVCARQGRAGRRQGIRSRRCAQDRISGGQH